jgi:hypothetical protein
MPSTDCSLKIIVYCLGEVYCTEKFRMPNHVDVTGTNVRAARWEQQTIEKIIKKHLKKSGFTRPFNISSCKFDMWIGSSSVRSSWFSSVINCFRNLDTSVCGEEWRLHPPICNPRTILIDSFVIEKTFPRPMRTIMSKGLALSMSQAISILHSTISKSILSR